MYRIELSPGEETAFRSIEELAVAIRRKVVTSRARIYHNATSKWLPIQFHPHYKLALTMPLTQADLVAGPPVTPLSGLTLGERAPATVVPSSAARESETQAALTAWPEPKPVSPPPVKPVARPAPKEPESSQPPIVLGTPSPEPRPIIPFRAPVPRRKAETRFEEQTRTVEPSRAKGSRRRRKPSRSVRVALAGAILIACAHLLVSAASPSASEAAADRPRTPRRLIEAPAEALKDVTPRTIAAVLPALQSISVPGLNSASKPTPPAAPKSAAPTLAAVESAAESARIESVAVSDSTAEIQPAPDAGEISGAAEAEFVAPQMVDSSGKQALKRILRSIGGSPAAETKPSRR